MDNTIIDAIVGVFALTFLGLLFIMIKYCIKEIKKHGVKYVLTTAGIYAVILAFVIGVGHIICKLIGI